MRCSSFLPLTLCLLFAPGGAIAAADHPDRTPPPCAGGSSAERAACARELGKRIQALVPKPRHCDDPSAAGTGPSPCFLNNVDSTCRYASGAPADICHTPRCAHGSTEYSDGSCSDDHLCESDTPRAGLPPDPVLGCGVSTPGAGGESFNAKGFLLKPGETRSGEWSYYVGSGRTVSMRAEVRSAIHGHPVAEAAGLLTALKSGGWTVTSGTDAPELLQKMVGAFTAGERNEANTGGQRVGFVAGKMPPRLSFVGGLSENSAVATASAVGNGHAEGYGYVTFVGKLENSFVSPVQEISASRPVSNVTVPGSCPALLTPPLTLPADSEYLLLTKTPRFSVTQCTDNWRCAGSDPDRSCWVESATTSGEWKLAYSVLGPNLWITDVDIQSDGSSVYQY